MPNYEHLQEWVTPVIVHTHTRLGTLSENQELEKHERDYHESPTEFAALLYFLQRFTDNAEVKICDTDHPMHFLLKQGIDLTSGIGVENIDSIINRISQGAIIRSERLTTSEYHGNVITGIEADIIDSKGKLDVSEEALGKLGIVVASFHYNNWRWINKQGPTKSQYFSALINTVSNPHVDILGHPCRDLHRRRFYDDLQYEDWHELLDVMSEKQVAYEINLNGKYADSEEYIYEREIIRKAHEKNVPLVLSLDFHNFQDYFQISSKLPASTRDDILNLLIENRNGSNFNFFMRIKRLIQDFNSLNITSYDILNSEKERFYTWLDTRNSIE